MKSTRVPLHPPRRHHQPNLGVSFLLIVLCAATAATGCIRYAELLGKNSNVSSLLACTVPKKEREALLSLRTSAPMVTTCPAPPTSGGPSTVLRGGSGGSSFQGRTSPGSPHTPTGQRYEERRGRISFTPAPQYGDILIRVFF